MREMKDSGIKLINEIPFDWNVSKIKYISTVNGRIGFRGYTQEDYVNDENGAISLSPVNIVEGKLDLSKRTYITYQKYEESPEIKIFEGDVVFVKTASVGKTCIIENIGDNLLTINPQFVVFKNLKIDNRFLAYFVSCNVIQDRVELDKQGGVVKTITQEDVLNYPICFPKLKQQKAIADFLDKKCSEIEALTKDIEKQIEVLEDYKKSVITEAVTKGLNSNVEMKDSGIEDIKINSLWKQISLKFVADVIRGGSPRPIEQYMSNDETGYNWIKIGDTEKGNKYINSTKCKMIPSGLSKTRLIKKGSLIMSNSMSFGQPYILNIDGCIHDGWVAFSNLKVNKVFLFYVLMSNLCMIQFKKAAAGGVVQNLNIDKVGDTKIYIPTRIEQEEIVKFLDESIKTIDNIISDKQKQLEIFVDYKKSLIYEYVTGKKEVTI